MKIKTIAKKQLGFSFLSLSCCLVMLNAEVSAASPNAKNNSATINYERLSSDKKSASPAKKVSNIKPVIRNQIRPESDSRVAQPTVHIKQVNINSSANKAMKPRSVNNSKITQKQKSDSLITNKPTINKNKINKRILVPLVNKSPVSSPVNRSSTKLKKAYKTPVIFSVNTPDSAVKTNAILPPIKSGAGFVPVSNINAESISNIVEIEKPRYTGMDDIIKEAFIYKSEFDTAIEGMFRPVMIKISNYGSRMGNSWYKSNDSYIDFDGAFGLSKRIFSIPPFNAAPYSYYVNNVYSQPFVEHTGIGLFWTLATSEVEVKGHCAASSRCDGAADGAAPDIRVANNMGIYVIPDIVVRNGSISFSTIDTELIFGFDDRNTNSACNAIGNDFNCSLLRNYENIIKNKVELELRNTFGQNKIKDAVASNMRYILDQKGIKEVTSVEVSGDRLIIKYRIKNGQMAMP